MAGDQRISKTHELGFAVDWMRWKWYNTNLEKIAVVHTPEFRQKIGVSYNAKGAEDDKRAILD